MVKRDIVVIGASAGGVEALRQLTAELPPRLDAALFVVVHMPPSWETNLPLILSRKGGIQGVRACADQPIEQGRIYVAAPDHHLVVDNGRIHIWRGPKENLHRPAINPLFRSAAVTYGKRVIGVILSGAMDDGSAGLWWVKRYGGLTVVQDPDDAQYPDMPQNALQHVSADYVLSAPEIGRSLPSMIQDAGLEAKEKS